MSAALKHSQTIFTNQFPATQVMRQIFNPKLRPFV